ncbi:MAG: GNAT family N-acetyltransferase [Spirochaetaceae bacterium]
MISYEEKSLNAWPSIKTLIHKGCLIRLSDGYTKRANSANPLYINETDIENVIDFSENIFSSSKLPTIFKIIDNKEYNKLDVVLEKKNYKKIDTTHVMLCDISEFNNFDAKLLQIDDNFSDEWLTTFLSINNVKDEHKDTAVKMLKNISVELLVASIIVNNKIVACGYAALEVDHIGIYDIIVDENYRGYGYGKSIMSGIINKAKDKDIKYAYLQVVASNMIANDLYKKLGFKTLYDYWYRKK